MIMKNRCIWVPLDKQDYVDYHDYEWGVPVKDDRLLFEMLILEGAQAGLSWYTILKRRESYRLEFRNFFPNECSKLKDIDLENILTNGNIVRNRLKVFSVRKNAKVFINIQEEFGSFYEYLKLYIPKKSHINKNIENMITKSVESDALSKDLKKRGMSFVGTTIIYAFMQAVGMVNDHTDYCFLSLENSK